MKSEKNSSYYSSMIMKSWFTLKYRIDKWVIAGDSTHTHISGIIQLNWIVCVCVRPNQNKKKNDKEFSITIRHYLYSMVQCFNLNNDGRKKKVFFSFFLFFRMWWEILTTTTATIIILSNESSKKMKSKPIADIQCVLLFMNSVCWWWWWWW